MVVTTAEFKNLEDLRLRGGELFGHFQAALEEIAMALELDTLSPYEEEGVATLLLGTIGGWPALGVAHLVDYSGHPLAINGQPAVGQPISKSDLTALNEFAEQWEGYPVGDTHQLTIASETQVGLATRDTDQQPLTAYRQIYPTPVDA